MRYLAFTLLAVSLLGFPGLSLAQDDSHGQSIESILAEILESQNIDQVQDLNCQDITDEQFEELGDAAMELYHPGEQHDIMDAMMGGEGSESLRLAHVSMGQNYLGCGNDAGFYNSSMMMGGGMMGNLMQGRNSGFYDRSAMMGTFNFSFVPISYLITTFLVWALAILGIVALAKWIKK